MPGAEPWSASGGTHGVLVLHGFTGNPQSMRPLAEACAAAGFTVELPLLPGHGTSLEDMLPTRWEDWSGAAEAQFEALAARCDRVVVTGLSMGGTLTCWLAERHPGIAGIAVVNPMIQGPDEESRQGIGALVEAGTDVFDAIGSDIKKEGMVESAYPGLPLRAALSLFAAASEIEADIESNRLLIRGSAEQVDEISAVLTRLDRGGAGAGSGRGCSGSTTC